MPSVQDQILYAVITAEVDGRTTRKWIKLDTLHKAIARRRMARLLEQPSGDASAIVATPETYAELAIYLTWQHPAKHRRLAVLQRQTMSVLARVFGGLRTGDLHAMQWTHFDVPDFTMGTALRSKTPKKQKLEVPGPLRPVLKAWWYETGEHTSGPVFPALRGKQAGEGTKHGVSHAEAFRRDLGRLWP